MRIKKTVSSVSVSPKFYEVLKPVESAAAVTLGPRCPRPAQRGECQQPRPDWSETLLGNRKTPMAGTKGVAWDAGGGSILRSRPLILLPGREGAPRHLRAPSASRAVDVGKQDGVHGQHSGEADRYSLFPSLQLGPEQSSDLSLGRLRWLFVQLGVELLELLHVEVKGRNDLSFTAFPVVESGFSGLVLHYWAPGGHPSKGWQLVFPFLRCHLTRTLDSRLFHSSSLAGWLGFHFQVWCFVFLKTDICAVITKSEYSSQSSLLYAVFFGPVSGEPEEKW